MRYSRILPALAGSIALLALIAPAFGRIPVAASEPQLMPMDRAR